MALATLGLAAGLLLTALFSLILSQAQPAAPVPADPERGKYLFQVSGCATCHGQNLAGWRAGGPNQQPQSAPFGELFVGPYGRVPASNITPDPETGIGSWTDAQIAAAIRDGQRPNGELLMPVMPYQQYHLLSDQDTADLVAFLRTVPAVRNEVPARTLQGPVPAPPALPAPPAEAPTEGVERGAYLVNAVAACAHCHSPKTPTGFADPGRHLSGQIIPREPEEEIAPNITPSEARGIGKWTEEDIARLLKTGFGPEGGRVGGLMRRAVEGPPWGGFDQLTDADLQAISAYLKSIPPLGQP
jgi:mono/diheme cytochrome c family protein